MINRLNRIEKFLYNVIGPMLVKVCQAFMNRPGNEGSDLRFVMLLFNGTPGEDQMSKIYQCSNVGGIEGVITVLRSVIAGTTGEDMSVEELRRHSEYVKILMNELPPDSTLH